MDKVLEWVKRFVVPVVMWRIAIMALMLIAVAILPKNPHIPEIPPLASFHALVEPTMHWDGGWYARIVEHGYEQLGAQWHPSVAFFPLFPLIVKGLTFVGMDTAWAGVVVNLLATIGACWFLVQIAELLLPKKKASRVLWLFLSFPTALLLGMFYTEALYCLTTFGAFYFYLKGKALPAGLMALLAGATRVPGILTGAVITVGFLYQRKWKEALITGILTPLGVLVFMYYLKVNIGDALAFITIHKTYFSGEQASLNVFHTLWTWFDHIRGNWTGHPYQLAQYLIPVIAYFYAWTITLIGIRKVRWELSLYSIITLVFLTITDGWTSMFRYILPLFPLYIVLAQLQNKEVNRAWIIAGAVLMGFGATLFSMWFWFA